MKRKEATPARKPAAKKKPAEKPKIELSPRQLAFAHSYATHGIAEKAAIEAGYAKTTARGCSDRLLANVGIRAEIDRLLTAATEKAGATVDRIVDELALMGFSDLGEFVEWGFDPESPEAPQVRLIPSSKLDEARRRAIVEVSQTQHGIRIKLADKARALELLGKHRGMFKDAEERPAQPIVINIDTSGK